MVYDVVIQDKITWLYYFGWVLAMGCVKGTFMLSISLLAKICPPELRGTMFSLAGLLGSVCIFAFTGVASYLYTKVTILSPYYFAFTFILIVGIYTLVLGVSGKMKV